MAIPFDNVDDEQIRKPQRWNPADLGRFMVFFGPISSIFDILTFGLMWWVFHANTVEMQTLFQSGWFIEGLLSQTLIVHMIRTRRIPFVQSRAARPLFAMTLVVMAVGIALPFSPLASYLQLQALPLSYFPWLVAILAGYMVLTRGREGLLQPPLRLAVRTRFRMTHVKRQPLAAFFMPTRAISDARRWLRSRSSRLSADVRLQRRSAPGRWRYAR